MHDVIQQLEQGYTILDQNRSAQIEVLPQPPVSGTVLQYSGHRFYQR
jgi:hypothetical protein